MLLSVAYTFEPGIIARLAAFPQVREIYGKLDRDLIGGGRSTYTLRPTSKGMLRDSVAEAHRHSISFNYLINGATLDGMEQTRTGQKRIRRFLDFLDGLGVDAVTVASPLLLKIVKHEHSRLKVRVSAFACIDAPAKARQWEDMGADTLCLSAIGCNRDRAALASIRASVRCDLQLIVNASCLPYCSHELTHMNLLTQSSRTGSRLGGFCLDYCFLNCSMVRLTTPEYFLRSIWIRPEDLHLYEGMGYSNFKVLERSCPGDLLIRRVAGYANRSFDGNLMELVAPVAQIKPELRQTLGQRFRMLTSLAKPWRARVGSLLLLKRYAERSMLHEFSREAAPVYLDNKALGGFIEGVLDRDCRHADCAACGYCGAWAGKALRVDQGYREDLLRMGRRLDAGIGTGEHWFRR